MSTGKPGGSNRRRMAGDAARRRREQADGIASESTGEPGAAPEAAPGDDATAAETEERGSATTETPQDKVGESKTRRERTRRVHLSAPPRETWWWLAILAVVTVAALVFVTVVGARYLQDRGDDTALAQSHEDATSAAATAAQQILSYDYQDLDADRAGAEKLMTEDFRKEYDALFTKDYCDAFPVQGQCTVEGKFPDVVKQHKQQVDASVVDVAPMECGDECDADKTRMLMFIDQSSTSDGKQQSPVGQRAVFTMVEHGGDWLVDGIAYV